MSAYRMKGRRDVGAKVAEMDKSRVKATIISVTSCSFVLEVSNFRRNPYIVNRINYLCYLHPISL